MRTKNDMTRHPGDKLHTGSAGQASSKMLAAAAICLVAGAGVLYAKGGTAKPPGVSTACPVGTANTGTSACIVPPAGPVLPNFPPAVAGALSANGSNGFAITGIVQAVTGPACPAAGAAGSPAGGTVTVNGVVITIPSNTIVQYPANTLSWGDAICGIAPLAVNGTGGTGPAIYPGVEISVDGNIVAPAGGVAGVGSPHVAGLVKISQQSVHTGSGYISFIDYTDGSIYVSTRDTAGAASELRLLINDPFGRFGRAQSLPDARFSVDDANPTIKAAASGYPMCVPRVAPPAGGGAETDPLCPQKNRPTGAGNTCRNFAASGVVFRIAGADLPTASINGFCTGFVMKALAGMPGAGGLAGTQLANGTGQVSVLSNTDPDPRQMAPFQVGDYISWQGTLVIGGNARAPASQRPTTTGAAGAGDVVWVHTIDANVGIYTQPGTLPAYIAIGELGIGIDPAPATAVAAAGVEGTPRIFLEASTSDIASVVDIYLDDKGFSLATPAAAAAAGCVGPCVLPNAAGSPATEYFRWLTPESMTGAVADQVAQAGRGVIIPSTSTAQANAFGGGIYTQFVGPQPGRARIRANKVPAIDPTVACPTTAATIGGSSGCAITQSPTRYVRAVLRSLCAPAATGAVSAAGYPAVGSTNLNNGVAGGNTGPYFDINGPRGNVLNSGVNSLVLAGSAAAVSVNFQGGANVASNLSYVGPGDGTCLQSAQYANGLFTGQYMAPVSEYIFPENTLAGFRVLPASFWHMGFMAFGENGQDGNSAGPQAPRPW